MADIMVVCEKDCTFQMLISMKQWGQVSKKDDKGICPDCSNYSVVASEQNASG